MSVLEKPTSRRRIIGKVNTPWSKFDIACLDSSATISDSAIKFEASSISHRGNLDLLTNFELIHNRKANVSPEATRFQASRSSRFPLVFPNIKSPQAKRLLLSNPFIQPLMFASFYDANPLPRNVLFSGTTHMQIFRSPKATFVFCRRARYPNFYMLRLNLRKVKLADGFN